MGHRHCDYIKAADRRPKTTAKQQECECGRITSQPYWTKGGAYERARPLCRECWENTQRRTAREASLEMIELRER